MRKANTVDINKDYVRQKIKEGGFKYVDLSRVLGMGSKGSLTGMISAQRMNLDTLKQLARIVDFPYEDALQNQRPKAYIKITRTNDIKEKLDQIVRLQKEINVTLVKVLKEL